MERDKHMSFPSYIPYMAAIWSGEGMSSESPNCSNGLPSICNEARDDAKEIEDGKSQHLHKDVIPLLILKDQMITPLHNEETASIYNLLQLTMIVHWHFQGDPLNVMLLVSLTSYHTQVRWLTTKDGSSICWEQCRVEEIQQTERRMV